ncbi:hypothetical protein J155_04315 [Xanthomonas citri pv. citri]|uniref:Uncharacterized protein n=4 Tax=Xanthomonas TaxID=338 RepID=A0AA44Z1S5_XANCM|nr:hypothetical protein XAC29_21055 [Xanthomonas axonopodis Xac29-1]AGI05942.1 Hypothetical Protein XCAW_00115 [Xanthomonas citri subsp. citri Aw12879]AJD70758.1 hypothetical protein J151_04362 [Xanthomonas citri subsp. citri A306]AJY84244.1 hypothetical protein J159_04311 [Xanthomonas citri pv. citri]AJY88670.1 hypothetical protein J158_04315 [Xanthomonas citri subsp. citri UI6]AOL21250.1 hypothetical protein BGK55_20600 [Xanthomonas citri pv. malvacearum]EKQ60025.1 hypothetical protein WS7_
MVNGDIDNCDVARDAVVDAITPPRLGLSLMRGVAIGICAISASWERACSISVDAQAHAGMG